MLSGPRSRKLTRCSLGWVDAVRAVTYMTRCHGHSESVRRNIQTQKTLAAAIPNPKGFLSVSALCNKQEQPDADPAAVFTCMGRRE